MCHGLRLCPGSCATLRSITVSVRKAIWVERDHWNVYGGPIEVLSLVADTLLLLEGES